MSVQFGEIKRYRSQPFWLRQFSGAVDFHFRCCLPPPLLQTGFDTWSTGLVVGMIYLGAFVTIGAFGLYNWGMSRIPASRASLFINLVPVAAVLFGWTLLGESLNPAQCLAAIGVIGGVCLSQMAHKNSD